MVVTIAPPTLSKSSLRKQRRKDAKIYNAQLQMKKKEQLWSIRLKKLQRPERKSRREASQKRTQSWLKIFKLAQFCNNSTALLNLAQIKRTEEQQMKDATTLIGQSLKKSYAKKKKKQHRRSSEILKSCAWIARLNVRCRLRQKNAAMIRDFIQRAVEAGRMTSAMRMFKYQIISVQRRLRAFFIVHRTRLKIMVKMFRKYEGSVVQRLERERKERERLEDIAREENLIFQAKEARKASAVATKPKSGSKIGRFLKDIEDTGRQLDSVAFRLHDKTKQARAKAELREKNRAPAVAKSSQDFIRVKKRAVVHVLLKHLRKKRKEHYDSMKRLRVDAEIRLIQAKFVNTADMSKSLRSNLTVNEIYEKKVVVLNKMKIFYPVVKLFTTLKSDLFHHLIVDAMKYEEEMNRKKSEKALKDF